MKEDQRGFAHILILIVVFTGIISLFVFRCKFTKCEPSPVSQNQESLAEYVSEMGNYSISYPENYELLIGKERSIDGVKFDSKNSIQITSSDSGGSDNKFTITIRDKQLDFSSKSLSDIVSEGSNCLDVSSDKGEIIRISDTDALMFEDTLCGPRGSTIIYALNDKHLYEIEVVSNTDYKNIEDTVRTIISTFKFISDTNGWKTYTSDEFNYSFSYPATWHIVNHESGTTGTYALFKNSEHATFGFNGHWGNELLIVSINDTEFSFEEKVSLYQDVYTKDKVTEIVVNGKQAIKYPYGVEIQINTGMNLIFDANPNERETITKDIFNIILSTIEIIS